MNFQKLIDQEEKKMMAQRNVSAEVKRNKSIILQEILAELNPFFTFLNKKYNFEKGAQKFMVSNGMADVQFNIKSHKNVSGITIGVFHQLLSISVNNDFNVVIEYGYINDKRKAFKTADDVVNRVVKDIAIYHDFILRGGQTSYKLTEK